MRNIKIEDIIFWIFVLAMFGLAFWLLSGSPTIEEGLISFILFVLGSELLIWKKLFSIDKRTEIGFVKARGDIALMKEDLNNKFNNLKTDIVDIKTLINKRR